ncbi:MAG: undecaprenyl-diphosphate phosphatase [Deltaproteobacteria bacterium]|nr:undecaprenyl-diphosphate phosphatase [Deltaproteobacteria bacterium]
MPELVVVVLLGLLEGLTEFIPVSSTGHLILLGDLLGFQGERAGAFDVFIQLGAILAVVVLYWNRFLSLLDFSQDGDREESFRGRSGIMKLAAACLPALVLGFLAHRFIKEHLFNSFTVALALIVGGVLMLWVERQKRVAPIVAIEALTLKTCFAIGMFQCLSLWPGMSRSGSTIVGGMLLGLNRVVAAEFSFLVAVPIMCAATGYDLLKSLKFLSVADIVPFGVGFLVAFVSAMLAISFFMKILRKFSLVPFAVYRIALGAIVLALR